MSSNWGALVMNIVILLLEIGAIIGIVLLLVRAIRQSRNPLVLAGIGIAALGAALWVFSGQVIASQQGFEGALNGFLGGAQYQDRMGYFVTANQMAPFACGVGVLMALFGFLRGQPSSGRSAADTSSIPVETPGSKVCPFCAETVKHAATVCRYCGRDLPAGDA